MTQVQTFEIGAGFLIIVATFAVMFFLEKKATLIHLVMIGVGAALAGVANLQVTSPDFNLTFTQVAQQSVDTQAAIAQLNQEVISLQQQNQQTVAALKALSTAQQATPQAAPTNAPNIIQGLEANQAASAPRQAALTQSLKTLQLSTARLAAAARIPLPKQ